MLNLGDTFPNANLPSNLGDIDLYSYFGDGWGIVFSHPKDFTPVCTTEISRMAQLHKEFDARGVKTVCISVDSAEDHIEWVKDVAHYSGCKVPFPLLADVGGKFSQSIGMLDANADNTLTVRAVFVIAPDRKVRAIISYPASTGRNFDEILRLIDSLQLTEKNKNIVTPVDWKGGDVLVKPGCEAPSTAKVVELPSGKDYMKFVKIDA
ncbi:peroxidase-like protein [Dinothrombium tinctorium]|uniref:thioredoxin-dependent peroxiredoxin n=1 Tax=Dinothrombium tinctorium TaxID=1965070 RepID=A0A3S3NZX5_9ACAR|nr:peroxidase-like protein [Dinothrombium tinctorium]RWS09130.1 peroxidase-like protein [Dinothrombium tinctorium]RWS12586.1 peroxidase-like protein [Dinothrombium tinctorium]